MKNYFNYDFTKKAIIGSKSAINRANSGRGNEYSELCRMLEEHPDFKVIPKNVKENPDKKKYYGLTFERMAKYISTQPDSENKLKIFEKVKKMSEAKGAGYPLTKKWFLKTYPEYKVNETIITDEEAEEIAIAEISELENEEIEKAA